MPADAAKASSMNRLWPHGLGLWKVKHVARALRADAPKLGLTTALHQQLGWLRYWGVPDRLPPYSGEGSGKSLAVYWMTGQYHWPMTCCCVYSLLRSTSANIRPVVVDDGTLDRPAKERMMRVLPQLQFAESAETEARLREFLPENRYPTLHALRRTTLGRKLVDTFAGRAGPTLFLDSDILFFREPAFLIEWLHNGRCPIYMTDYQDSYGYSPELLASILGKPMPRRVNAGILGYLNGSIDWDEFEYWAKRLRDAEGLTYFVEQTLSAMYVAKHGGQSAPAGDYLIAPELREIHAPTAVMHHYVTPSRGWYYSDALPRFVHQMKLP
jgi:hypothetical protein